MGLTRIYVNARNIINKMDYLKAEVKVFDPDIIGITESWTDDKISDAQMQMRGLKCSDRIV